MLKVKNGFSFYFGLGFSFAFSGKGNFSNLKKIAITSIKMTLNKDIYIKTYCQIICKMITILQNNLP